jgi:hypothetical protein
MKPDDVYEQWKQQASSVEAPSDFEAKVMAGVRQSDSERSTLTSDSATLLDHPAWATAAVLAASLVGLFRVAFALLIGIW